MSDLETVHKEYLDSFRRYRDLLENKKIPLTSDHPVFGAIEKDNLFSEGLRAKILQLDPLLGDKVFGDFLTRVKWYVSGASTLPEIIEYEPWDGISQMRRVRYRNTFKSIINGKGSDDEKRRQAIGALDESVHSLQLYYKAVLGAYAELKKKLLKPR